MAIGGNRVPVLAFTIADKSVEIYRLTFANTDNSTFDITTSISKVELALISSEVQAVNGGKLLSAIPKTGAGNASKVTVTISNGTGAQAPTSVLLIVIGSP